MDYLFVTDLTKDPILQDIDVHSGYSQTKFMINREMDNTAKAF